MRATLEHWIADTETRYSLEDFQLESRLDELAYLDDRIADLYLSLVGALFDSIRSASDDRGSWSTLGHSFASLSRDLDGATKADALFFSAAAFYCGGFPASAVMTIRLAEADRWAEGVSQACFDLLSRQGEPRSESVRELFSAVRDGRIDRLERAVNDAEEQAQLALQIGPEEWIAHRIYATVLSRFLQSNVRTVLPDGSNDRWSPLVESLTTRRQPVWEFFPSQIEAIEAGLLTSDRSYSLQMPTGAGKTALTEVLLFNHLADDPGAKAVLLVPYRALARELRFSVSRHLAQMGLQTRVVYGGTVPTVEEGEDLDDARVIIATPEALTGLLGTHPDLIPAVSLLICDEGHLLASRSRGVSLELLLARFLGRERPPRMVFISAIVPNVDEINAWLGGTDSTLVESDYRPALAEYAVLRPSGSGRNLAVGLELQELSTSLPAHTLPDFLRTADFEFLNPETKRVNTYSYDSKKVQAVATARKSLPLGTVAIFAAVKTGPQGVISLAKELVDQISAGISLPQPDSYIGNSSAVEDAVEYLAHEYGPDWVGTEALAAGAVVHHGDLPQETREVLEELLSENQVRMVLCTSTLAEGVNLPIRTLVLYSVRRGSKDGVTTPMLARDIKNLVGRAGRAGSSTRGLVICVNPSQWSDVSPVAAGEPGEQVEGALIDLLRRLEKAVEGDGSELENGPLEATPALFSLVDGIDATLIELIHDELGNDEFERIAESLAADTFAARQADENQRELLTKVFRLRASRLLGMRSTERLAWAREAGARPRLIDSVIDDLYPRFDAWSTVDSPLDQPFIKSIIEWAEEQPGFAEEIAGAFDRSGIEDTHAALLQLISAWIEGRSFADISYITDLPMDKLLRIHNKIVLYDLATLVEQALAVLNQFLLASGDGALSPVAAAFPDYVRYGVPTPAARELMAKGMRHRCAAVELGKTQEMATSMTSFSSPASRARRLLEDEATWRSRLGDLVYRRSVRDVSRRTR